MMQSNSGAANCPAADAAAGGPSSQSLACVSHVAHQPEFQLNLDACLFHSQKCYCYIESLHDISLLRYNSLVILDGCNVDILHNGNIFDYCNLFQFSLILS
jgi:hypothetical protein